MKRSSNINRCRKYVVLCFFAIAATACFAYRVPAQYCGGSIRTISLEYPVGSVPARSVNYQLFYIMPKMQEDRRWGKHEALIAEFLYGSATKPVSWKRSGDTTFLEVPKDKAETFIRSYKPDDYKYLSPGNWSERYTDQMVGKFDSGVLQMRTAEADETTFIMQVSARGYETQYLLSNFMGGCHSRHTAKDGTPIGQKIIMKASAKFGR